MRGPPVPAILNGQADFAVISRCTQNGVMDPAGADLEFHGPREVRAWAKLRERL